MQSTPAFEKNADEPDILPGQISILYLHNVMYGLLVGTKEIRLCPQKREIGSVTAAHWPVPAIIVSDSVK